MTENERKKIDDLFYSTNVEETQLKEIKEEKIQVKKQKEREKRIKQKNKETKKLDKFDYETETVIGMTKRNKEKKQQQNKQKITKKQKKLDRKKKRIKFIIKIVTFLVLLIGGIIFALVSPIFNIREIEIKNNNQITAETIISLSQLQKGQNIFKFNKREIDKQIKTNAYIENLIIDRKLPNKVIITIKEREKNFNVEFLNGYAYINKQGYILEVSEQKIELPIIQGILTPQEELVAGNRLNEQDLEKLETVIKIIDICKNYGLDKKITSVDISDLNNFSIYIEEEKKTIYLGDKTNLNNKMLYVPPILEENKGKEGYIYINGDLNDGFNPRFREKV